RLIASYGRGLDVVLQHQTAALLVMVATVLLTAGLYLAVPKGFFPVQDSGVIQAVTEAPQDISFEAMAEQPQKLVAEILQDPDVASLSSFIGVVGSNISLSSRRLLINLELPDELSASLRDIIDRLLERITSVPGITAWFQPVQEVSIEDRVSRTQCQFTLTTPDSSLLDIWVPQLIARLNAEPALDDVASDLQTRGLQAYIEIDRDAAARLGVRVSDITSALQSAYSQRQIATLFTQANQYRVVLEVDPDHARGLNALETTFVSTSAGRPVLLSNVARVTQRPTPLLINHQGQFPSTNVSFNLASNASLGEAIEAIER